MYLSKIHISNYKGIEKLEVNFSPKTNVIIGENGCCKSALIDAIRLLYNLGEPMKEITVSKEDFYESVTVAENALVAIHRSELIRIAYEFRELTPEQKGAFFEYMVAHPEHPEKDFAQITIQYNTSKTKDIRYFPILRAI